jgi:hypothetical protein
MKRLILTLIFLLLPAWLYAATITSTQSGSPIVGSTWVGGAAPGIGDTAVIATGHTITLPNGYTWTVGTEATFHSRRRQL